MIILSSLVALLAPSWIGAVVAIVLMAVLTIAVVTLGDKLEDEVIIPFWVLNMLLIFTGHIVGEGFVSSAYPEVRNPTIETRTEVETQQIVSLDRSSGVNGTFALGFGVIGDRPVYYAYQEGEDGGLRLKTISNYPTLYETIASGEPAYFADTKHFTRKTRHNVPPFWRYVTKRKLESDWQYEKTTTDIYVPVDTVKREFTG